MLHAAPSKYKFVLQIDKVPKLASLKIPSLLQQNIGVFLGGSLTVGLLPLCHKSPANPTIKRESWSQPLRKSGFFTPGDLAPPTVAFTRACRATSSLLGLGKTPNPTHLLGDPWAICFVPKSIQCCGELAKVHTRLGSTCSTWQILSFEKSQLSLPTRWFVQRMNRATEKLDMLTGFSAISHCR